MGIKVMETIKIQNLVYETIENKEKGCVEHYREGKWCFDYYENGTLCSNCKTDGQRELYVCVYGCCHGCEGCYGGCMKDMAFCSCSDCLKAFYGEGAEAYTDNHGLEHHERCNHITEKVLDTIKLEEEVYVPEYDIYVMQNVVKWEGYRCTCEHEYDEEDSK
jgi:hypothetical protein